MALIKCINCGHMISDKAVKCPKCGTPIQMIKEAAKPIEKEEKVIAEVETPKAEIAKAEAVVPDEPKSQTWKKVSGIVIFAAIIIGGIYFYMDSQNKAQLEKEAILKAKADSAMVADSLARMAAAEQARQDSINAADAIRQKFVRFADVYCTNPNINNEYDIDKNLFKKLKERGYIILKTEEDSEYYETFEETIVTKHYYLGMNMEYGGYWKAKDSPCSGIECVVTDVPYNSYTIVHFDNVSDMDAFLIDAVNFNFKKSGDQEWTRNTPNSYLIINKIGDKTLKCHSQYPN